jgi:hypothetical protein
LHDQQIELTDPDFIFLGQEEASEAVRLLAALIRVADSGRRISGLLHPRLLPRTILPMVGRRPRVTTARRIRPTAQVTAGERSPSARPMVLRTVSFLLAVLRTFGGR